MSLSKEPAYSELKNHFVVGYRNIMNEPYAGNSGTHKPNGNAVDTTNGAGPHNIQMFVMNPDGTVVHCLPGYWNPKDLAGELDLARKLNAVYTNGSLSPEQKSAQFTQMQLNHIRQHSTEMVARSHLQGFDMKAEAHKKGSDAIKDHSLLEGEWNSQSCQAFKTTDQIMHERMAKRPFLTYNEFDVAKFADYGTHTYDKHEDSLDESGHMVAAEGEKAKFEPIKNPRTMREAMRGGGPGPRLASLRNVRGPRSQATTRKIYVRTYGVVRRMDNQP